MNNKFEAVSKYFVLLIDILYAVTIGEGLTRISEDLTLPQEIWGFMSIEFCLFIFALVVILRDWIEYHVSIKERPHRSTKRFALDIVILLLFFFLIRTYKDMEWYLSLLTLFFVATVFWNILERYEWPKRNDVEKDKMKRAMRISILYSIYYALFPLFLYKEIARRSVAWNLPSSYLVFVFLCVGFIIVPVLVKSNRKSTKPSR